MSFQNILSRKSLDDKPGDARSRAPGGQGHPRPGPRQGDVEKLRANKREEGHLQEGVGTELLESQLCGKY